MNIWLQKRFTLLLVILAVITQGSQCNIGNPNTPRINNFEARPEKICRIPNSVNLHWALNTGTTGRIESRPSGFSSDLGESGSVIAGVNASPTTFTLTATNGGTSTNRSVTVNRISGVEALALGGIATCTTSGIFIMQTEVLNSRYSEDVVIKRLQNTSSFEIGVISPTGLEIVIPALSVSDALNNTKVLGVWTITTVATSVCTPPGGSNPVSTQPIGLEAQVGCQ